jgi:hypothetical protein
LLDIDDTCAHGTLRDWAVFTRSAVMLCTESGRDCVDEKVAASTYALLGGGVR